MSSKTQDLINRLRIHGLVKDHFCFDEESLRLFKYRLLYEPHLVKEYKKILKNSKDLRLRIDLSEEELYVVDDGWRLFRRYFSKFVEMVNVTYKGFRNNIVEYKGRTYKIKKALVDFYAENFRFFLRNFNMSKAMNEEIVSQMEGEIRKENLEIYLDGCNRHNDGIVFRRHYEDKVEVLFENIKPTKELKRTIEYELLSFLEDIGRKKIPTNRKLQIVLSLNFADWFLCSSAENWGSCLDVNSDHYEALWTGLPGLIGDKNRALLYITDGQKKTMFGITVDKMLSRSWVLVVRRKADNRTLFSLVKEYPNHFGLEKIAHKYLGMEFIAGCESFLSRYYIELLKHEIDSKTKYLSCIFQDNSILKVAKKNKTKLFFHKYGYLQSGDRGHNSIVFHKEGIKWHIEETKDMGWIYCYGLQSLVEGDSLRKRFSFNIGNDRS